MRSDHLEIIESLPCWQNSIEVEVLSGGMTNFNYKVRDGNLCFVVRLGDDVPEHLVLRENEGLSSEAAASCGFSPAVIHRQKGVLVIEFVEGDVLTSADIQQNNTMVGIVDLMKAFHTEMPHKLNGYPIMFWVFQVLKHYCARLEQGGSSYQKEIPELMAISARLEQAVGPVNIVYGHNDLLAANFIRQSEKIWLIDFDYAGFNSPLFDLANLASNNDFDKSLEMTMLERYFANHVTEQTWNSYCAMKCASLLRETMWSMVSELFSSIDFDYAQYTDDNRSRFVRVYEQYKREFG